MFSLRKDAKDVCPARSLRRNELRCQALAARTTLTWMTGQHGRAKQACIPRGAQDGAQALAPGLAAAINALPEMPLGRANWEHPNLMMCVMSFLDTLEVEDRKEAKHCCSALRRNWSGVSWKRSCLPRTCIPTSHMRWWRKSKLGSSTGE